MSQYYFLLMVQCPDKQIYFDSMSCFRQVPKERDKNKSPVNGRSYDSTHFFFVCVRAWKHVHLCLFHLKLRSYCVSVTVKSPIMQELQELILGLSIHHRPRLNNARLRRVLNMPKDL